MTQAGSYQEYLDWLKVHKSVADVDACQSCGYPHDSYQLSAFPSSLERVDSIDDNEVRYYCGICIKTRYLDRYSIGYKGEDKILYLPQISQEDLNAFYHTLKDDGHAFPILKRQELFSELLDAVLPWKSISNKLDFSNPSVFCQFLDYQSEKGDDIYESDLYLSARLLLEW